MEELSVLDDVTKSALLLVLGYLALRVSVYGQQRLDRHVLSAAGAILWAAVAVAWTAGNSQILSVTSVCAVLWLVVIIWKERIPGLQMAWPAAGRRRYLWLEMLLVCGLGLLAATQLELVI
jgi:hypothetical protein